MMKFIKPFAVVLLLLCIYVLTGCNRTYDIPTAPEGKAYISYEGKSNYCIVRGEKATESEIYAAKELQKYLKKITGFKLPIVKDSEEEKELEIIVGKTNRENIIDRSSLGDDGFSIMWSGNKLIISGGETRGTIYGVYEFLESLGCRFFAESVETIPVRKTLELAISDPVTKKPAFEYRDLFWSCTYDPALSVKLRLNGCLVSGTDGRTIPNEMGGGVSYAGPHFVHTFTYLVPADEYFDEHPEYFSEINGKRTGKHLYSQLCLTNPDVLQICIEKVKNWLDSNPDAKIVSVSQNDSFVIGSFCTCDKCKQVNREERSNSGTIIRFVNAIADAIKDGYPDVSIDTLAYQYSVEPPRVTKPRENVIVRVCTGGCSAHAISECTSNSGIKSNVTRWAKISERIYIWDYTTNFAQYLCPYPNLNSLQPNLQFFYENNVKGVFEQGNYQEGKNGEFGELRSYLLAKLLWDPYTDVNVLINEFMDAYYGGGSKYIKEYIDALHKMVEPKDNHFNLVVNAADLYKSLIKDSDIEHFDSLWENAKKEAGSKEAKERILRSELSYRYYKMISQRGEFADTAKTDELTQQFYKDCHDLGVERMSEGANVPPVNV